MTASAFAAQVALLAALAATVGLTVAGWAAGIACGAAVNLLLARGLLRSGAASVNPANAVTLTRATLVGAVTALVADGWSRPVPVVTLVVVSALALSLDAVDGQVARRTGSITALGARFDMEVDAFLILVLSVLVSRTFGVWVLAIGLARYVYVAGGWIWRWLRATAPARPWRKTVAAIQGITLTVAVADFLPRPLTAAVLALSLFLLTESFGRDVWWLWQRHHGLTPSAAPTTATVLRGSATAAAVLLLWAALVLPQNVTRLTPGAFVRIPLEGVLIVAMALILRGRSRTIFAAVVGALIGLAAVLKILDIGFSSILDRPFNPVIDLGTFGSAIGVLRDSAGQFWTVAAVVGAVLLVLALLVTGTVSAVRLARIASRHRRRAVRTLTAVGGVWLLCAGIGLTVADGHVASAGTAVFAYQQVSQIGTTLADQRTFAHTLAAGDPTSSTPAADLLTGLRDKDVIIVVVESYGLVAVHDSPIAPGVDAALAADTATLRSAGFDSRSGFLTSPTFGGISWLAHSTLQSGLWIDSQQRYDQLLASDRFTLSDAFKRAGWRTVVDIPSNTEDWPAGRSFYHYDQIYNATNVGYAGPHFSYGSMPDQYTLAAFQRNELDRPDRGPVMAEIDLVSSHTPWAPLPRMVDPSSVGDGSIFDPMPAQGRSPSEVWREDSQVQQAYGQSIQYSLAAITSFVQNSHDDNLVLVVYGDHQPSQPVTGAGASHTVPISIIAHDPAVLDRISGWGWQDGLLPGPQAPVWPMDQFRDRFLSAYGGP